MGTEGETPVRREEEKKGEEAGLAGRCEGV